MLASGLTLVMKEHHGAPTVALEARVLAGSAFDPPGRAGLSALTASLVAAGSTKRDPAALAKALDEMAATLDVSTGREAVTLRSRVAARDLDAIVDLVAAALTAPSFAESALEARRKALSARAVARESSPAIRAEEALY